MARAEHEPNTLSLSFPPMAADPRLASRPGTAFAHPAESHFRPEALIRPMPGLIQGAPARQRHGPGARRDGQRGAAPRSSVNIEYGQRYLEYLRDHSITGGLLPRVIAAYNAGPAPVALWNVRFDQGDPLLFLETIPYWETRGYVPIVLRNYWIYEQQSADRSVSRRALAAGLWPRFPGLSGPTAVRIAPRRPMMRGD